MRKDYKVYRIYFFMIYQTELLDLNNPDNAKFISALLYDCLIINGERGKDPNINVFYFKYHENKEKSSQLENQVNSRTTL
jgi:hypothetical protein